MLLTLNRHKAGGLWVIFIYMVYSLVTELVNFIMQYDHHVTSYFNFNLFGIIEYCLLTYYIRSRIRNTTLKSLILILSGLFLIVSIIRISGHYFNVYDSLSNGLESILLIIYSIFYFFEQISKPSHIFFYSIPEFWIIVAILLYFSGTFFIDTYAQGLIEDQSFKVKYSVINNSFAILQNLLFGVAMIVKGGDKINDLPNLDHRTRRVPEP
jgi:hypothetical protein